MRVMPFPVPPPPETIRLANDRVVSYYEFGDPAGAPMFALHGTPSAGACFVWAHDAARERGIRLLAPDRPGIGLSDHLPRNAPAVVSDYPPELAATADALGIG